MLENKDLFLEQYKTAVEMYNKLQDKIFHLHKFFIIMISSLIIIYLFILEHNAIGFHSFNAYFMLFIFVLFILGIFWTTQLVFVNNDIISNNLILKDMEKMLPYAYMTKMIGKDNSYKYFIYTLSHWLPSAIIFVYCVLFFYYFAGNSNLKFLAVVACILEFLINFYLLKYSCSFKILIKGHFFSQFFNEKTHTNERI